jgi:hypothetical protein
MTDPFSISSDDLCPFPFLCRWMIFSSGVLVFPHPPPEATLQLQLMWAEPHTWFGGLRFERIPIDLGEGLLRKMYKLREKKERKIFIKRA